MALVLCIETATMLCSVALGRDGRPVAERSLASGRHVHAEKVAVFIQEVMDEAGTAMRELDAVAVGIGPGSYTGLRIGLSAAKGLCFSLRIPVIGMGTLGTLAAAARAQGAAGRLWPMVDARRMEVFTQPFGPEGAEADGPQALVLDEAWAAAHEPCTVAGEGADKAAALWAAHPGIVHLQGVRPEAHHMIGGAEARLRTGRTDDLAYLVPHYGKEANVTQPGKKAAR